MTAADGPTVPPREPRATVDADRGLRGRLTTSAAGSSRQCLVADLLRRYHQTRRARLFNIVNLNIRGNVDL